jgi:hypothetical protein
VGIIGFGIFGSTVANELTSLRAYELWQPHNLGLKHTLTLGSIPFLLVKNITWVRGQSPQRIGLRIKSFSTPHTPPHNIQKGAPDIIQRAFYFHFA